MDDEDEQAAREFGINSRQSRQSVKELAEMKRQSATNEEKDDKFSDHNDQEHPS